METDVLIVGAGFAGMVMAERLASIGKRCVVIDKRCHIGGNAYDYVDEHGVLVHKYGPHLFHTNSDKVFEYLSRFTSWIPAKYTAASYQRDKLFSFPINLETFEQWVGGWRTSEDFRDFLESVRFQGTPANAEEAMIARVGYKLYRMFYAGYTSKMWGRDPKELDASLAERLPVRLHKDDRYFEDKHQCMPAEGYTKMFQRMLMASPNITLQLNLDSRKVCLLPKQHLVYTGPIDEFFDYRYGKLPYRTVGVCRRHYPEDFVQKTPLVVYPNQYDFTRSFEAKHVTGQQCAGTTVTYEVPSEATADDEPYYPIPAPGPRALYQRYKKLAEEEAPNVTFIGRLARYRYINMDQVVAMALHEFDILKTRVK